MGDLVEIMTSARQQKYYYRVTSSAISFEVKGPRSAGIGLHRYPTNKTDILIGLGENNNWRSFIVKRKENYAPVATPQILDPFEYRRFWLCWLNDEVQIGYDGCHAPFLRQTYSDMNLRYITFFVLGSHDPVYWKFELPPPRPTVGLKLLDGGQPVWVNETGHLPDNAIVGGFEDEFLYIIRAAHEGSLTPGKLNPGQGRAYISWGGRDHEKLEFEVLCGYNYVWVSTTKDRIPSGAIVGGYSEDTRECLYIGRASCDGHTIPGKVQVSHRCCYIPYKGREILKKKYDILVNPQSDARCISDSRIESESDDNDNDDDNDVDDDNNDSDNDFGNQAYVF